MRLQFQSAVGDMHTSELFIALQHDSNQVYCAVVGALVRRRLAPSSGGIGEAKAQAP